MSKTSRFLRATSVVLLACFFVCPTVLAMDGVRRETRTDRAFDKFGMTGRGVIVGILDRGIDWTNNDFRNDDGSTRIAYIFDLNDDAGAHAPGNTYGVGTVYSRTQIDAALTAGTSLPTRDAVGHGCLTTGIAAGNGRNLPDRRLRGIAPEATIIMVKVTGGAPAHDDQPAEPYFYRGDRVPTGIDFIRDKALELGMPCVMLLNLGSQVGPTDGTSVLCRKIDSTVGPGKHGIVFVTGPGDEGGSPNRTGGTLVAGHTTAIQIQKATDDALYFDLWYSNQDRIDVSVQTPGGLRGPYAPPATERDVVHQRQPEFEMYHTGSDADYYVADNAKRELAITIDGAPGLYTVNLVPTAVGNGRFDGTLNPAYFEGPSSDNKFLTEIAPGSIWDGATARNNICPGDYVFRSNWTDIDHNAQSLPGQGDIGDVWRGSSTGPTFDGRLGVDVCAPGDSLFATYGAKTYWATFRFNLIEGGGGLYGRGGAVSAAAPTVTGIIALMLQMDPTLDASEIKQILQRTGRRDAFTGPNENPTWGYGKVDAFGAIAAAESGTPPVISSVAVNVAKGKVTVKGSGFATSVEVFLDGIPFASTPKVKAGTKVVQKGALANGKTLAQQIGVGDTVQIYVRNSAGGTVEVPYTRH